LHCVVKIDLPRCNALYQLLQIEAGAATPHGDMSCRSCGTALPARQGNFAVKYLFLRNVGRQQGSKRPA
jgi:hypothetical protein